MVLWSAGSGYQTTHPWAWNYEMHAHCSLQTNKLIHRSFSYCLQKYMFVNKCRVFIHIYFIKQLCVDIESHILPHGGLLFIVYRSAGSHNSSIIGISTLAYISVSILYWQHRMWKKHPNAQNTFITEGSRNNKTI